MSFGALDTVPRRSEITECPVSCLPTRDRVRSQRERRLSLGGWLLTMRFHLGHVSSLLESPLISFFDPSLFSS